MTQRGDRIKVLKFQMGQPTLSKNVSGTPWKLNSLRGWSIGELIDLLFYRMKRSIC